MLGIPRLDSDHEGPARVGIGVDTEELRLDTDDGDLWLRYSGPRALSGEGARSGGVEGDGQARLQLTIGSGGGVESGGGGGGPTQSIQPLGEDDTASLHHSLSGLGLDSESDDSGLFQKRHGSLPRARGATPASAYCRLKRGPRVSPRRTGSRETGTVASMRQRGLLTVPT